MEDASTSSPSSHSLRSRKRSSPLYFPPPGRHLPLPRDPEVLKSLAPPAPSPSWPSVMTTRSAASTSSVPHEDSDVYAYALRVAVLSSAIATASSSSPIPPPSTSAPLRPSSSFRPADGWANAILSLGDSFKDSGGKDGKGAAKFPKELVKVLDAKMEKVARGADVGYTDALLRQTIGAFYGTYAQPGFQRKMKDNRQIEELILMFVTTASAVLKKRLEGDEWKPQLNSQVGSFVSMIRDCLKSREVKNVPPELLVRLETYCAKLVPSSGPDSYSDSSASTSRRTLDSAPPALPGMVTNVQEMPLVQAVGRLFGKPNADLTRDVVAIRRLCTEKVSCGGAYREGCELMGSIPGGVQRSQGLHQQRCEGS